MKTELRRGEESARQEPLFILLAPELEAQNTALVSLKYFDCNELVIIKSSHKRYLLISI
jgi:hypothetical protein